MDVWAPRMREAKIGDLEDLDALVKKIQELGHKHVIGPRKE